MRAWTASLLCIAALNAVSGAPDGQDINNATTGWRGLFPWLSGEPGRARLPPNNDDRLPGHKHFRGSQDGNNNYDVAQQGLEPDDKRNQTGHWPHHPGKWNESAGFPHGGEWNETGRWPHHGGKGPRPDGKWNESAGFPHGGEWNETGRWPHPGGKWNETDQGFPHGGEWNETGRWPHHGGKGPHPDGKWNESGSFPHGGEWNETGRWPHHGGKGPRPDGKWNESDHGFPHGGKWNGSATGLGPNDVPEKKPNCGPRGSQSGSGFDASEYVGQVGTAWGCDQ